ncbi:exonuclease RNase T and DNA polymerase III [Lentinus tigrinus ALCF2SS1-7]|uniref:exonuclease RNase T and DNA polymerase III n=1 Tax=Lentinus tigrinus ALCF2SS1-7 TaxID=1328758 RepID=UPI001166138D|nr:exonuclease RNase T and DNA polymerase III [Lentinus tigrinus ALCF2SS1-7]
MSLLRSAAAAAGFGGSARMRLRYLLILDFEATCDDSGSIPRNEMEIIEFPTLLYDIEQDQVKAVFHQYVHPICHPTLTQFCTELTGIEQSTVNAAYPFPSVWERYQAFLQEHGVMQEPGSVAYLTCGEWDLKTMLPMQLRLSGTQVGLDPSTGTLTAPYNRWINVKKSYQRMYGLKNATGMAGMLRNAHMKLEGRHHSGIDDCKNILRIVQKMRKDGWKPWNDLPR